ncbi:MAG: hypothetical protein ABUL73_04585 [Alphaproteobacteria bacterium]
MLGVREKTETRTPPSRRWRNYYKVYHVLYLGRIGPLFPGVHPGPDVFPSQELAEQHALFFVGQINPPGRWFMEFAGAFPEGDRAN